MTKYDNARAMIEKTLDVADTYLTKAEAFTEVNLTAVFDFAENFITDVRNKALDNVDQMEVKETGGETTAPDEPVVDSETEDAKRERLRNEVVKYYRDDNDDVTANAWAALDINGSGKSWLATDTLQSIVDETKNQ